ncbi:MAG: ThuA domain-containing protein [Verrucomicrobia bacterium]|nr:MAG: ThuA domain-containing protein [Verrucomicrobiota bacterium]TAE89148.1 MAG: ThuA domain-containing protein [Verrucomicrobiota bacterium]TAF27978.1 MAG: ThuA domain-containing protein [Verrucomicrobiota bacterium]TAF42826.1 MAG: ThuA domain-containing protein [Verrucomicrobiota bacterium]
MTKMKPTILFPLAGAAAAFLLASAAPDAEQAPPGSAEKIAAALPTEAAAKPTKARKVLVFSRTAGFRHASIATGKLALTELGRKTGAFEAVISDDLANFEPDRIAAFDAIVFLSTTQDVFSLPQQALQGLNEEQRKDAESRVELLRKSLMDFVKGGKGFVGIHAATDTFYNWSEYGEMVGGYFDGHPWTADRQVSIKVEPGQERHPLASMFDGKNLDFKEEIYQFKAPYDSKKVHMLLRLDPEKTDMKLGGIKRTDKDFGVSWARSWGEGRMFYCSLGHNHDMYWHPLVLRHYLAGIQWAIGDLEAKVSR